MSEDRLVVRIGPERLCARIDSIPPGVAVNDVLAALRANDIGMGICHDAIADAVRRANETGEPVRQLVAARGLHPRAPASATSSFRLPGALTEVPDLEYVTSAWTVSRTAGLARACRGIAVWLVKPGDALWAAVVDYGEPGVNLLGGVTPPPRPPRPSSPPVGDGVELARQPLEAAGDVDGVAHHRELEAVLAADVAQHDGPVVNADADAHPRLAAGDALGVP